MSVLFALDMAPPWALVTRKGDFELIVLAVAVIAVGFIAVRAIIRRMRR